MKASQKTKTKSIPLAKVVRIVQRPHASTNIDHDKGVIVLEKYLPSSSALDTVERLASGMGDDKNGRMLSITGPYGSGKSTMAVFIDALLSPEKSKEWKIAHRILGDLKPGLADQFVESRKNLKIHKLGLIKCMITANREPIAMTIIRALDDGARKYFGKYKNSDFDKAIVLHKMIQNKTVPDAKDVIDVIVSMCKKVPMMILIDEFGKNIEYFTSENTEQSDLFLLQQLAEMSGKARKIPLFIMTLQHMSFEEYAFGASTTHRKEWAKIQGRFEDIPFANSPNQTRLLAAKFINQPTKENRNILKWAKKQKNIINDIGISNDTSPVLISSLYPLHPLAIEVLPDLCTRYGQHERTLLSFIAGGNKYTIASFVDEAQWVIGEDPPTLDIDVLYDYFVHGSTLLNSVSYSVTRLMEIETIIRDSHGLSELELKTLKIIGVLNLLGRSGPLRASTSVIRYAIGTQAKTILQKLEEKSIITYRKYADEYRIWQGSDIDILAKLEVHRKRHLKTPLVEMLTHIMKLDPIVAAKHSIETGTMRLFERRFADPKRTKDLAPAENFDGLIVYLTGKHMILNSKKSVIFVEADSLTALKQAAIEVMTIREILGGDEITSDWVARKELEERLVDAEVRLEKIFGGTYGASAKWSYLETIKRGNTSSIVSEVCDDAYPDTPKIRNEMINRTVLSGQGSSAQRRLMTAMITNSNKLQLGIEGWGPDRAIYESVLKKTKIHRGKSFDWHLSRPDSSVITVWDAMINKIKRQNGRVTMSDIYQLVKLPPFGVKDGVLPVLMLAILLIHKNNMAVYEHGTYCPSMLPEIAERMVKNPNYFEIKYFTNTEELKSLIQRSASSLGIKKTSGEPSMLDIVGHLVRTINILPNYTKKTKNLDKHTLAVRDVILKAVEPDVFLFEELPKAIGVKFSKSKKPTQAEVKQFATILSKSIKTLQSAFDDMLNDITKMLYDVTGNPNRKKLTKSASTMLKSVSDQGMKVFLTAIATTMENNIDWINYVALTITNTPPADWTDEQRAMFKNNLMEISGRFKRVASLHFSKISDSFTKPAYQLTITHADGYEDRNVISLKSAHKKQVEAIAQKAIKDMAAKGLGTKDMGALVAELSRLLSSQR